MTRRPPPPPPNGDGPADVPVFVAPDSKLAATGAVTRKAVEELVPLFGRILKLVNAARDAHQAAERDAKLGVAIEVLHARLVEIERRLDEMVGSAASDEAAVEALVRDAAHELRKDDRLRASEVEVVLDSYLGLAAIIYLPATKYVPERMFIPHLVKGFAKVARSEFERAAVVESANEMRLSMADVADHESKQIDSVLLPGGKVSPADYWYEAFRAACAVDSRMVACLLLVQDPSAFPERGQRAHRALLEFLTDEPDPR